MHTRPLGQTGLSVPVLGLGTAPLGGVFGDIDEAEGIACTRRAIDLGLTFVDSSPYYGITRSETVLGRALADGWRNRVTLCTKAGRITKTDFDFSADYIARSCDDSLRRLGTDHLDVLIAHDIEFADDYERVFTETADALHRLKRAGKTRFVGMSGYPLGLLRQAVERCNLDVVLTYCHYTLLNTRFLDELAAVAEQHGVGVINGSPLAMGLLTMNPPPAWHPAPDVLKEAARRAVDVCRRHGVDLATLGIQFAVQQPRIACTLTGTARTAELERNLRALTEPVDPAVLAEVRATLADVQGIGWPSGNWREG